MKIILFLLTALLFFSTTDLSAGNNLSRKNEALTQSKPKKSKSSPKKKASSTKPQKKVKSGKGKPHKDPAYR